MRRGYGLEIRFRTGQIRGEGLRDDISPARLPPYRPDHGGGGLGEAVRISRYSPLEQREVELRSQAGPLYRRRLGWRRVSARLCGHGDLAEQVSESPQRHGMRGPGGHPGATTAFLLPCTLLRSTRSAWVKGSQEGRHRLVLAGRTRCGRRRRLVNQRLGTSGLGWAGGTIVWARSCLGQYVRNLKQAVIGRCRRSSGHLGACRSRRKRAKWHRHSLRSGFRVPGISGAPPGSNRATMLANRTMSPDAKDADPVIRSSLTNVPPVEFRS